MSQASPSLNPLSRNSAKSDAARRPRSAMIFAAKRRAAAAFGSVASIARAGRFPPRDLMQLTAALGRIAET
jgi:hypothetical protein